jgi:hypothetical protein
MIGKPYTGNSYVQFDEGEPKIVYGWDPVTLTDERVRNIENKLQPIATTQVLYSIY